MIKSSPVISPSPSTINESVPSPQITPAPKIETPPPVPEIPLPTETKSTVVTEPAEKIPETSSRLVVNRNVVIAEPNRKVVQTTSNRVVVSSKKPTNDSDSDLDDLIEQENDTKKSKNKFFQE